ncbi:sporulation peptidase YabG [Paenibacillus sp. MBLB4367]|uniref:sporulation peptidase YabG n=1 Tax=Paenibacillus sp. MBLB4367 TaxID=3384767 RepID=UPI003907FF87
MRQGDLVVRKSYNGDIVFRIQQLMQQKALLKGTDFRLLADSPLTDLSALSESSRNRYEEAMKAKVAESMRRMEQFRRGQADRNRALLKQEMRDAHPYFEVPGKVLHLDGDQSYMRKSMDLYNELGVPAQGFYVPESQMADALQRLLPQLKPDIVVLTGHDGLIRTRSADGARNLASYKNSHHFVNAVNVARQYERNRDALVIFAGACQSYFEALLMAGANFASSPRRVLIHALDPLYIASKVSLTPIKETVHIVDVIHHTMSGLDGLGGIETRGSYRIGLPSLQTGVGAHPQSTSAT